MPTIRARFLGAASTAAALVAAAAVFAGAVGSSSVAFAVGIAVAASVAAGWAVTRVFWAWRFFQAGAVRQGPDRKTTPLQGLPNLYFLLVLLLSASSAGAMILAVRSGGGRALAWGMLAMVCGCAIAIVRHRGYSRRMGVEVEVSPDVGHDTADRSFDRWQRVSHTAADSLLAAMTRAFVVLLVVVALIGQVFFGTSGLLVTLAALVLAAGLLTAVFRVGSPRAITIAYLLTAVLALVLVWLESGQPVTVGLGWACVACVVAPLALPRPSSWYAICTTGVVSVILMVTLWSASVPVPLDAVTEPAIGQLAWLLTPSAAMCLALVSVALTSTLHLVARVHDDLAINAWNELQSAIGRAGFESAMFEAARIVHDTLINTLGALRVGVVDVDRIRQRLRNDLDLIDAELNREALTVTSSAVAIREVLHEIGRRAQLVGVTLTVDAAPETLLIPVHPSQADALTGAAREALTNVSKHSADNRARLSLDGAEQQLRMRIESVAAGPAVDSPTSGGLRQSIIERCRRAAIAATATVDSDRVVVEMTWRASEQPAVVALDDDSFATRDYVQSALVAVSRSISFWPIGYCILLSAAWIGEYTWWWWIIGVMLVISPSMAVVNAAAARGPVAGFAVACGATTVLVLLWQLNGPSAYAGTGPLGPMGMSFVGAAVIAATMLSAQDSTRTWLANFGGFWLGSIALATALAIRGEFFWMPLAAAALFTVGGVVIVVGKRHLAITGAQAQRIATELASVQAQALVRKEQERARQRTITEAVGRNREFLDGLADGSVDLRSESTLTRAAQLEHLLRNYVQVGSAPGPLADELFVAIGTAVQRGIDVEVVAVEAQPDVREQPGLVTSVIDQLIAAATPGARLSISTYRDREHYGITLVIDQELPAATPANDPDRVEWIADEDQTFVEIRLLLDRDQPMAAASTR